MSRRQLGNEHILWPLKWSVKGITSSKSKSNYMAQSQEVPNPSKPFKQYGVPPPLDIEEYK